MPANLSPPVAITDTLPSSLEMMNPDPATIPAAASAPMASNHGASLKRPSHEDLIEVESCAGALAGGTEAVD